MASRKDAFRFRQHDQLGAIDAESDMAVLRECFIDANGEMDVLLNCGDNRRIVVGRTGSGKSALLNLLAERDAKRSVMLSPDNLALNALAQSDVLSKLLSLGIDLNVVFKSVWRMVLATEVAKMHGSEGERTTGLTWDGIMKLLDRRHKDCISRMQAWIDTPSGESGEHVRDIARKVESEIAGKVNLDVHAVRIELSGSRKTAVDGNASTDEVVESVDPHMELQKIVNGIIPIDPNVYDVLNTVLKDPQKNYYVLIDKLDDDWVHDDTLKLLLIRALIDEAQTFMAVKHVKIIIALRIDLYERVLQVARAQKAQREKYDGRCLNLVWTRRKLEAVIDKRIAFLVMSRHPGQKLTYRDVLPAERMDKRAGTSPLQYILDRTLMRPRDAIDFFNKCISLAGDHPRITKQMITDAEGIYSRGRVQSVEDEWAYQYPSLSRALSILDCAPSRFRPSDFAAHDIRTRCEDIATEPGAATDDVVTMARHVANNIVQPEDYFKSILAVLYHVGVVGLKLDTYEAVQWAQTGRATVDPAKIASDTSVEVHPAFWRALNVH